MLIAETAGAGPSADSVVRFFHSVEQAKLAFADWENRLVGVAAERFPTWNSLAITDTNEISGGIIGGEALAYASISHMAVCPKRRSKGLGSRMVQQLFDLAQARSRANAVHLIVTEGNERAREFWAQNGFVVAPNPIVELSLDGIPSCDGVTDKVKAIDDNAVQQLLNTHPNVTARLDEHTRMTICDEVLSGQVGAWHAVDDDGISAVLFAGSLGVRGIMRLLVLNDNADLQSARCMLNAGVAHVAKMGVLRLHAFPETECEKLLFQQVGFAVQPGETTMIRPLGRR